jgi:hypothetical protein
MNKKELSNKKHGISEEVVLFVEKSFIHITNNFFNKLNSFSSYSSTY